MPILILYRLLHQPHKHERHELVTAIFDHLTQGCGIERTWRYLQRVADGRYQLMSRVLAPAPYDIPYSLYMRRSLPSMAPRHTVHPVHKKADTEKVSA